MRYITIIFAIFFTSCYTQKKAEKSLEKAQIKFPEVVAKKTSQWYPCGWAIINLDSAEKVKWSVFVDSVNNTIYKYRTDTIYKIEPKNCDEAMSYSRTLRLKLGDANNLIDNLQKKLNLPPPTIYRTVLVQDSARMIVYQNKIDKLQGDKETLYKKMHTISWLCIWILILLAVSLLANYFRFRK